MESTIYESFILPSKGMVYDTPVDPHVTLRSMTVEEEMIRVSPTEFPYKVMSDLIQGCMKDKPAIDVYNMCMGDYQFLLHKLRIVTYGPEYKMTIKCDDCKKVSESIADLDSLELKEWNEDVMNYKIITLPVSGKMIELKFETPRDLDMIAYKAKELKKKTKKNIDYSLLFVLMSVIKTVDGQVYDSISLEEFVKTMSNKDANYLLNKATLLGKQIGLDTEITVKCSECEKESEIPFRITSEFFRPTNY